MKTQLKHLLLFLFLIGVFSCKKDIIKPESDQNPSIENARKYNWSEKEKKFFNLENTSNLLKSRSSSDTSGLFHPRLIKAYQTIAEQNDTSSFAEHLLDEVGIPLWKECFVYSNHAIDPNIVVIPMIREGGTKINGVLTVHEKQDGRVLIEGKTRNQLMDLQNGNLTQKLGLLKWVVAWEQLLFGETGDELFGPLCALEEMEAHDNLPPHTSDPCPGFFLEICFIPGTSTFWYGSLNAPPHLDHDHDGIPNDEDDDFLDLGITQQEFETEFYDWWEDEMQDDYGTYDNWYDDYYDDPDMDGYGSNFDEEAYEDFWDEIENAWNDFENWAQGNWDDIGDWFDRIDDLFEQGPQCPWGGFANVVDERSFSCDWFYVYDCVHDPWWLFADGVDATFRYRLSNYWEFNNLGTRIDFLCLEEIAQAANCDPFVGDNPDQQGFESCVMQALEEREVELSGILSSEHIPAWFTLKDALSATCHCTFDDTFSTCALNSIYRSIANSTGANVNSLSDVQVQSLVMRVFSFCHTYIDEAIPFEDFGHLAKLAAQNDCLNTGNFELCLANQVFVVAPGDGLVIGSSDDLALALYACFNTTTNSSGYSHNITLYIDQPIPGSSRPWRFPDDVGHTFIGMEQMNNSTGQKSSKIFGFYPSVIAFPGLAADPGQFRSNSTNGYDVSITWNITSDQFNSLIGKISATSLWDTYHLNHANCTDFARWACDEIGLGVPVVYTPIPDITPIGVLITPTENPGALGEAIRSLPMQNNEINRSLAANQAAPQATCD